MCTEEMFVGLATLNPLNRCFCDITVKPKTNLCDIRVISKNVTRMNLSLLTWPKSKESNPKSL